LVSGFLWKEWNSWNGIIFDYLSLLKITLDEYCGANTRDKSKKVIPLSSVVVPDSSSRIKICVYGIGLFVSLVTRPVRLWANPEEHSMVIAGSEQTFCDRFQESMRI
jgi:hypothetical protein